MSWLYLSITGFVGVFGFGWGYRLGRVDLQLATDGNSKRGGGPEPLTEPVERCSPANRRPTAAQLASESRAEWYARLYSSIVYDEPETETPDMREG